MDLAIFFGMVISSLMIGLALLLGGEPTAFMNFPSFLIVCGGTIGAVLTQYPAKLVWGSVRDSFNFPSSGLNRSMLLDEMVNIAYYARREGILSLEKRMNVMENPFFKKALQLAIDGIEPDSIRLLLNAEMESLDYQSESKAMVLDSLAMYSPALGMMGTVIGLVQMLNTMDDPSSIGPAMAIALITTFYGIILANLVFLPLAGRIRHNKQEELYAMEMIEQGIIGIAHGENPRLLRERLISFLSDDERLELSR